MTTPLVVLTATTKLIGGQTRVRLNDAYVQAARAAGLAPLVLPPLEPGELEPILDAIHGVILTGGEDMDPATYRAAPSPASHEPHTKRDRCELAVVHHAREHRLPTFAICRGIQVVNVALGGTLIQDIPSERPSDINHDQSAARTERVHSVRVEPDSRLAAAMGTTAMSVNSFHHQAVARVAQGLRVTARSPDGVIEGVEWIGDEWWMLGVQWHPEELMDDALGWDRALFDAFANQARAAHPASFQRASSAT